MIHRCENPRREKYKDYGKRGIGVCKEWHNFKNFKEWAIVNGYNPGLQIDRIDNDGNYDPLNCRWVTAKENCRNRRNTKYLTINEQTKSIAEWCENMEISNFTVYDWYRRYGREYAENRLFEVISTNILLPKTTAKKVINYNTGLIFPSVVEASKFNNVSKHSIARVCRNKQNLAGGMKYGYLS